MFVYNQSYIPSTPNKLALQFIISSSISLSKSFMEGMDHMGKGKGKKGLIQKTWNRCRSLHVGGKRPSPLAKSKSWPNGVGFGIRINIDGGGGGEEDKLKSRCKVAPEGCFTVYVGQEKQRFVIRTQYANHPLFKLLLEEAELEYGYNSEGPLVLPCNVGTFYKVVSEMEMEDSDEIRQGCNFTKGYGSYKLLSPARMVAMN